MKKILLWDPRRPADNPVRVEVDDVIASACVRAGVAAAADPAEAGSLAAGAALDPSNMTDIVIWTSGPAVFGMGTPVSKTIKVPQSVALIAIDAGLAVMPGGIVFGGRLGTIMPSASWTSTAGSGFSSTPSDPTRNTAKPILRLLVAANQYYSDKLLVGFGAAANDSGSLMQLFGLSELRVLYEGAEMTVPNLSYQMFVDPEGTSHWVLGFWFYIARRDATNGHANLYASAVPRDGTMQTRVMGPFQFSPWTFAATGDHYDYKITIAPSQSQIAGSRYTSILNAHNYLVGVSAQNPLITIVEPGTYDIGAVASTYQPQGRFNLTASVPATIGKASYTTDTNAILRTKVDAIHFMDLTIDFAYLSVIYHEVPANRQHWLDRCRLIDSLGRGRLWRGGARGQIAGHTVRDNAVFTECIFSDLPNPGVNASLARACTYRKGYSDVFSDARCVATGVVQDWTNNDYATDLDSFSLTYTGVEATASLNCSADASGTVFTATGNDASSRRFTLKWGANSATFNVVNAEAGIAANTYWPSDVVNWINGLGIAGMTASLLNNTRRATYASLAGMKGVAFNDTNIKNATLTVVTMIDLHNDGWQGNNSGQIENTWAFDINLVGFVGQVLFPTGSSGLRDAIFGNIAAYNSLTTTGYDINEYTHSQFSYAQSHVMVVNVSLASQGVRLQTTYTADSYCMFANCSFRKLEWVGTPSAALVIKGLHLQTNGTNPSGGVGTTIGGTYLDLYVDAPGGDFRPAGLLAANLKTSIMPFDRRRKDRGVIDASGALSASQ